MPLQRCSVACARSPCSKQMLALRKYSLVASAALSWMAWRHWPLMGVRDLPLLSSGPRCCWPSWWVNAALVATVAPCPASAVASTLVQ